MSDSGGWFSCRVERTGPAENGTIYVWLNDQGGKFNHWFVAADVVKREILSVALTAMSTGLLVDAAVESTKEYGILNRIYLKRT